VFAADRDNAAVDRYFDDAADPIFRLLRITHDDVPDIPLSVCGEPASRPEHIPKLLQCGIRTVSAPPPLLPMIKEAIRNSSCAAPLTRSH
jgi:phosphoenolpyruvate-protein kinase (PTS system EI component)